jgi:hypothetical protein
VRIDRRQEPWPGAHPIEVQAFTCSEVEVGDRGTFDVDIALGERFGLLECVGLAVRGDGHQRIDGDVLRKVRVAELVREVATWLEETREAERIRRSIEIEATPPMGVDGVSWSDVSDETKAWYEQAIALPIMEGAGRYRQMIREAARAGGTTRLVAAASIYKRAARRGRPATKAVAEELGITYNAAAGLVRRCRETVPPLIPPKPGRGRGGANALRTSEQESE